MAELPLTEFLKDPFSQPPANIPIGSIKPGYTSSMVCLLKDQTKRTQTVNTNSILDFSQLENDPNFDRSYGPNQESILSNVSKLGISTQTNTAAAGLAVMSTIKEILPENMRSTLMNFMSLGSAGSKTLQTPAQLTQESTWEKALTLDLNNLFGTSLSFAQIASMGAAIAATLITLPTVLNTGTANVLPLSLQQTTPNNITAVISSEEYETALADTALTVPQQAQFTNYLSNQLYILGTTPVSNLVTVANYQNIPITMNDPLGIYARSQLQSELQSSYNSRIVTIIEDLALTLPLDQTDIGTIVTLLVADATNNVNAGFSGKFGLPSLNQVVKAVKAENKNFVINGLLNAFNNISVTTISKAGLNQPTDPNIKPVDYLQNVKKNLELRVSLQRTGATQEQLNNLNAFFKSVIADGNITPAAISQLNDQLNTLLKQTIEVC